MRRQKLLLLICMLSICTCLRADILSSLRNGYDPSLVIQCDQIPRLITFVGDENENWEIRLIVSYALQIEPFYAEVRERHQSAFDTAQMILHAKLNDVFDPTKSPARDVIYRLQGMWMAGKEEPTTDDWKKGSFASWLNYADLEYDLSLYDQTTPGKSTSRDDLEPSVRAAVKDAMTNEFRALNYYGWLQHEGVRTVKIDCFVKNASVGEEQFEEESATHYYRKSIEAKVTERAAGLMTAIEKLNQREREIHEHMDRVEPGYTVTQYKPYDPATMSYRDRKEYYRNRSAYERANYNSPTYTQTHGNRYLYERLLKELTELRQERALKDMRLHEEMQAQSTSVLEETSYTRTKQSRTCKSEGLAGVRIELARGAEAYALAENPKSLSWLTTWTFSKTTWPGRPDIGLKGNTSPLRSADICRRQTIDGCFHGLAEFFVKSVGQGVYPWVARTNPENDPSEAAHKEYRARALLTFFEPAGLLDKWKADGARGLDDFLSGRRSQYLLQRGDPEEQLFIAASRGNVVLVEQLLHLGTNTDTPFGNNETPLHRAAANGHLTIVKMLLDKSASISSKDNLGRTALHYAALYGHAEIAKQFLAKGAEVEAKNSDGHTSLMVAVSGEFGHATVVELLIQAGAELNVKDNLGRNLLHRAALSNNPTIIELLLTKGFDIESREENEETPLHIATDFGKEAAALFLIEKGADIHATDKWQRIPLHFAAESGLESLVKTLVARGADVHKKNEFGNVPLHYAAKKGTSSLIEFLVAQGCDINTQSNDGWVSLHIAIANKNFDVAKWLINHGAHVNAKEKSGWTALHEAANAGHMELTKLLLDKGADPCAQTDHGVTPADVAFNQKHDAIGKLLVSRGGESAKARELGEELCKAISDEDIETAEALIAKGASVTYRWRGQETALHLAAKYGYHSVAEKLIARGAPVNIRDEKKPDNPLLNQLDTPLNYAIIRGHDQIVQLLIDNGADVNLTGVSKKTPLHNAADKGRDRVVELLLTRGANLNAVDNYSCVPLHYAARDGNVVTVKFLIDHGAKIDVKTEDNETPLMYAVKSGSIETVNLLLSKGADPKVVDSLFENTLLHWAVYPDRPDPKMVTLITNSGIDLNAKNDSERTALHECAKNGHVEIIEILLNQGADMYIPYGESGRTAMHLAIGEVQIDVVKLLMSKGYDVSLKDKNEQTPLDLAKEMLPHLYGTKKARNEEIIKLLQQ